MKENSRFSQTSRLVTANTPNNIGYKWRFFRFSAIFKNISIRNTGLSAFTIFYQLFITALITVYPYIWASPIDPKSTVTDLTYFPNCNGLQKYIPGIISIELADTISFVLIMIPIISFILCFFNPDLLLFLHYFLSPQIISIIYPYTCVTFSYTAMYVFVKSSSVVYHLLNSLLLVAFLIFLALYMALTYIDNNSIIAPNNITGEWFLGYTSFMPVFTLVVFFTSLQTQNMGPYAYYSTFTGAFIIILAATIYCILESPMLNGILNCMIAAHYILILGTLILGALQLGFNISLNLYFVMLLPLFFCLLFISIRFLNDRRRIAIQQFLDQLDSTTGEYSVSAISTTLESIKTERQVRLLIHEGLQTGNQTVYSPAFVQFCLEKFPKSSWIASYVSFLFAISWGTNPRVYKFMLHILSLDYFGVRSMHLFQAIYCIMQTSERISPVIARELDEYRIEVSQFASIHRTFWRSVLYSDADRFHDAFIAFHTQLNKLNTFLRTMSMKYPYCSSIAGENALFYADMKHNFLRSAQYYTRTIQLLNPNRSYIVNDLFSYFSMLFPICTPTYQEPEENIDQYADELRFISLIDSHEHALRYMTQVSSNDEYLQALSHAFTVPTAHQPVDIIFDRTGTVFIKLTFSIAIVFFLIVCIVLIFMTSEHENARTLYYNSIGLLNSMVMFRNEIHWARHDVRLISDILLGSLDDVVNKSNYINTSGTEWETIKSNLYKHTLVHISHIEQSLSERIFQFETRQIHRSINFSIPNCNSTKCSFQFLYSGLHQLMQYLMSDEERDVSILSEIIDSLDRYSLPLIEMTEKVFTDIVNNHNYHAKRIHEKGLIKFTITLVLIAIAGAFVIVIHIISMFTMKKNMYAVIKTIQHSMLKSISSLFDKLITLEQHQRQTPHDLTFTRAIVYCALAFCFLMCDPVFMVIAQLEFKNELIYGNNTMAKLVDPKNITQFLMYTTSILEATANNGLNQTTDPDSLFIAKMALNSPEGCIYYMFNTTCPNCFITTPYFANYTQRTMWTMTYSTIILAFIFIMLFALYGYKVINISSSVEDIMKFVPQAARKSNPVLTKIMIGKRTNISEVSSFAENARQPVSSFDFFSIICMDPLENITEVKGDIKQFLPFVPSQLCEVVEYIINNSTESADAIRMFFAQKKPLETRSVAINDQREIAFTFSRKGTILLIKDDTHHHTNNNRLRIAEKLKSSVAEGVNRRKAANFVSSIIIIVESMKKDIFTDLVSKFEKIGNVVDTRNRRIICICETSKAQDVLSLMNSINMSSKDIRAVVHGASAVSVLQSAPGIEKSRLFGISYDEAKVQLSSTKFGEVSFTNRFNQLLH